MILRRKAFVLTHEEIARILEFDTGLIVPRQMVYLDRVGEQAFVNSVRYDPLRKQILALVECDAFDIVPDGQLVPVDESAAAGLVRDFAQMTREQLLQVKEEVLTALYDLDHPRRT
jgi:hypothetical protein